MYLYTSEKRYLFVFGCFCVLTGKYCHITAAILNNKRLEDALYDVLFQLKKLHKLERVVGIDGCFIFLFVEDEWVKIGFIERFGPVERLPVLKVGWFLVFKSEAVLIIAGLLVIFASCVLYIGFYTFVMLLDIGCVRENDDRVVQSCSNVVFIEHHYFHHSTDFSLFFILFFLEGFLFWSSL